MDQDAERPQERPAATRSFFRILKTNPPTDRDYMSPQEWRGDPSPDLSDEKRRSWDALSFYDTEEGAREQARQIRGIGRFIARHDFPLDAGITWEPSLGAGHYDVRGDKETIKRCLTSYIVPI